MSTRLVGALIMAHGDDGGLRLPPALAPVQVVVLVVRAEDGAGERAAALADELRAAGLRVDLDARVDTGFGRRAVEWEIKGVPVRVEVGPRDLAAGTATLVRRDTSSKEPVALDDLVAGSAAPSTRSSSRSTPRPWSAASRARPTCRRSTRPGPRRPTGFARLPWDLVRGQEDALAADAVTVRCLQRPDGGVPLSSDEPDLVATVAKAY